MWYFRIFIGINLIFLLAGCDNDKRAAVKILRELGPESKEFSKVIKHYESTGEKLKLEAAYFIIKNLRDQYHYEGIGKAEYQEKFSVYRSIIRSNDLINRKGLWDSLQMTQDKLNQSRVHEVLDYHSLTADYLISNIDFSFIAWNYPWARSLTFDQFCEYILPYKVSDELPSSWRKKIMANMSWLLDSAIGSTDPQYVCKLLNENPVSKFYINGRFFCPWDLNYSDFELLRTGTCRNATQFTAYNMRAMGIPVVMDFTPLWGNKNGGHTWNALLKDGKSIHFVGTESNPGMDKLEFTRSGRLTRRIAKVYRHTFSHQKFNIFDIAKEEEVPSQLNNTKVIDVTSQYVPVGDVKIADIPIEKADGHRLAYLCVFNNLQWNAIAWAPLSGRSTFLHDVGRQIIYLPAVYDDLSYVPIGSPFFMDKDGIKEDVICDTTATIDIRIYKKYPYPVHSECDVIKGNNYELFYWNDRWISMGKKIAAANFIEYKNVPKCALFWLRNPGNGNLERIFTIKNGKQIWW